MADATLPLFDDYRVSLEAFEGPLDLLLFLIRKEEVDICDIPIERIAEQYLAYLRRWQSLDINLAGEFVVMAATLMLIKSRTLLPRDAEAEGDEAADDGPDPRFDLVRQLIEYKRCKETAERLAIRELLRGETFPHGRLPDATPAAVPPLRLGDVGIEDLLAAFRAALARARETVSFGHLKMHRWSVPEKIRSILGAIAAKPHLRFDALFPPDAPKGEIIVTFVALLELLRLRQVSVTQTALFGDLWLDRPPPGAPEPLPIPADDLGDAPVTPGSNG